MQFFNLQGFGDLLLSGTWVTVKLALASLFFGLLLGILGAMAKQSKILPFRWLATAYTTVVRGIPELVLVLIVYFGASIALSAIAKSLFDIPHVEVNAFVAGVIALSLAFGAYATETIRMALLEVPKGQWESAYSIGMGRFKAFFRIIMPQMWRIALPGLGNLFQCLLKDTALISVVGLQDIMRQADVAITNTREPFTFYFVVALIYLVLTVVTTLMTYGLERLSDPSSIRLKLKTKLKEAANHV